MNQQFLHPEPQQPPVRMIVSFQRDRRGPCAWFFNILWLLLGGWHMFLTWFIAGIILCATCVGIPCGWQVLKISIFLLFPFGTSIVHNSHGEGCCMQSGNCFMNVLWALTVGWLLALQALVTGVILCMTILGIPFGIQCFKLTVLCFCPFGADFTTEETVQQTLVVPYGSTVVAQSSNVYALHNA